MSWGYVIAGAGSIVGGYLASEGSKSAANKQAMGAKQARAATLAASQQARMDALGLFNPALQDFATGISNSIDQVVNGQMGTTQILQNTVRNADQVLLQGSTAAQAAILGIDPSQYQPYQQARSMSPQQATQARSTQNRPGATVNRAPGPGPVNPQQARGFGSQQMRTNDMVPGSTQMINPYQQEIPVAGAPGTFVTEGGMGGTYGPQLAASSDQGGGNQLAQTSFLNPIRTPPTYNPASTLEEAMTKMPQEEIDRINNDPQYRATVESNLAKGYDHLQYRTDTAAATDTLFGEGTNTQVPTSIPTPGTQLNLTGTGLTGIGTARNDISSGSALAQQYLQQGTNQSAAALGQGAQGALGAYNRALNSSQGAESRALQALLGNFGGQGGGGNGLAVAAGGGGFGQSMVGDPNSQIGQGVKELQAAEGRGLEQIQQGTQQGLGYLDPYNQMGQQALQQQAALSGAAGADAQQAAINQFIESPGQKWLRDRQEQALLRNAAAIGGLGGGTVRTALQDQAYGIAAQQQQQQIQNLAQLAGQGQQAAGQQAGIAQQGGVSGGNLIGNLAGQAAGLRGTGAQIQGQLATAGINAGTQASIANAQIANQRNMAAADLIAGFSGQNTGIYGNQANVYSGLGGNLANLFTGQGVNQANLANQTGLSLSDLANQGGLQLANIINGTTQGQLGLQTGLGSQLAAYNTDASNNIANLLNQAGTGQADMRLGLGSLLSNLATGQGTQLANLSLAQGQAQAAGSIGSANAWNQAIQGVGSSLGGFLAYNNQGFN